MIKFFRKIRQKLLSQGKTGKYMKYAIGEILLVVIGIIIALQVNNWNQERIERNEEQIIFKKFIDNLNQDKSTIEYVLNLNKNKLVTASKLHELSNNESIDFEEIDVNQISTGIRRPLIFTERNKATIERIKDQKIRNQLIEYAFLEKRFEEVIIANNQFVRESVRSFLRKNKIFNLDDVITKNKLEDVYAVKNSTLKIDVLKENLDGFEPIIFEVHMYSLAIIEDGNSLLDKNEVLVENLQDLIK